MPAAVMPSQPLMRNVGAEALIEDALQIFEAVSVVIAVGSPVEKCRWRQLFRVADNDDLLAARDTEHLMDLGVIMNVVVDAVAPRIAPAVAFEQLFEYGGRVEGLR